MQQKSENKVAPGPNKLAERMALGRAMESTRPADERLYYDPYAARFVGPELGAFLATPPGQIDSVNVRLEPGMPGMINSVAARVRFFDDLVREMLGKGLEQLVILGAGYDTRPYRIEGLQSVRVFEVDRPATVEAKKEKIGEIFGSLPAHVTYVPVDFEQERLDLRLAECGYDPSRRTLFTMEGVIMYLDYQAVDALLAFMAQNRHSAVAFDYGRIFLDGAPQGWREQGGEVAKFTKSQGDVIKFGMVEPVEKFLADRGFTKVRNLTDEDIHRLYFEGKRAYRKVNSLLWLACGEV